jgi:hypothetical protein
MKKLFTALCFVLASAAASANNYTVNLLQSEDNPSAWTASITQNFTEFREGPWFRDVYTFAPTLSSAAIVNLGLFNTHDPGAASQSVTFSTVTLNGTKLDIENGDYLNLAVLGDTAVKAGKPLVLEVLGKFGSAASYSGTINVTMAPVPEPTTYAMLLGGLGLMGAVARRRAGKAV